MLSLTRNAPMPARLPRLFSAALPSCAVCSPLARSPSPAPPRRLLWYAVAIKPLERASLDSLGHEWYWSEGDGAIGVRYVCCLYWALSVMTSLKGLPAHESRQCLYVEVTTVRPIAERVLTICVFMFGSVMYSGALARWKRGPSCDPPWQHV